jgi:hypothetical protein
LVVRIPPSALIKTLTGQRFFRSFGGLAGLPDTVTDRTVRIELRRKARHERTERLRLSKIKSELAPLAEDLAAWSKVAADVPPGAEPELPEQLSDRQQDSCEVLVAIADHAGGLLTRQRPTEAAPPP